LLFEGDVPIVDASMESLVIAAIIIVVDKVYYFFGKAFFIT
jgi:hypothetical protein